MAQLQTSEGTRAEARTNGTTKRDALAILEQLSRIGARAAAQRNPESVVQCVIDDATALVGAQFGAFFYNAVSDSGESYTLYTLSGVDREAFSKFPMPRKTAVFAPTFDGEGIVRSDDITKDPRYGRNAPHHGMPAGHLPVRSYLAASVKSLEGEVLGGLFFGHATPGVFDEISERALAALVPVAAAALSNARLVTSLTKSEKALRDGEARHRLVVEATQDGVWFWDVPSNTVTWNERLLELMGVSREEWGGRFDDWFQRLHPDDQPRLAAALKAHLEQRVPYRIELFRLKHASGEYRWCTTFGQAEWDEQGRPLRMAGSFRDITAEKLAEDALRASHHRYAQILDSVKDMIFTKDERFRVTWANAATCNYYGHSVEELRALTDVPPDEVDFTKQYNVDDRTVFQTGQTIERTDEPSFSTTRSDRTFHTVKSPIRDTEGKVVELVGVARDVTDRKREVDFQRLLAHASAILGASIEYERTLANVARATVPAFADWAAVDMLDEDGGLRRLAVEHTDPEKIALAKELQVKYPPDMDAEIGVPNVLRTGKTEIVEAVPQEMLIAAAKGDQELARIVLDLGLVSYIIVPLTIQGQAIGAISFVTAESKRHYSAQDLTFAEELARRASTAIENARLYARVTELASTLERRVEQRTEALVEANKELESFTYTVSHDLRAPIRHIGGFVDLLRASYAERLDERGIRHLDTIKTAAVQMGALIDGLLDFSRLGRAELAKRSVALDALVRDVIGELEPELAGRKVVWSIGELPIVRGDPTMLRLVVANYIQNAVKYTRDRDEAHIEVGARYDLDAIVVWVRDDGVGFNMAYVEKLFGVFQRLHANTKFEGTGIGLATARRVVHRHGGRTWAEGAVGQGATFFFTLPIEVSPK